MITRFELVILIEGAGVPAASSTIPLTARTDTEKQQPLGTVTIAVEVTLLYSSAAAGVTIARPYLPLCIRKCGEVVAYHLYQMI